MLVTRALLAWQYRCDFSVSIIIMYLKAMFNLSYMWGKRWGMGYKGGGVTGGHLTYRMCGEGVGYRGGGGDRL